MRLPNESGIRRVQERVGYSDPANPYVTVFYDDVVWPDGRHGRYNRIVEGSGLPGVVVLPITDGHVGLVQVDRYPVNRRLWEAPRGFGDGPDPASDARRELREETGWDALKLIDLGSIYLNSGLLAGEVRVFAATVEGVSLAPKEGDETTAVALFTPDQLTEMLLGGELPDAATQSALLLACARGLISLG